MNLTYLLDTDWVIDHLNAIEAVTRRVQELRPAGLGISVVSLAELYEGVHYSRDPVRSRAVLRRFLAGLTVLPVEDQTSRPAKASQWMRSSRKLPLPVPGDLRAVPIAPDGGEERFHYDRLRHRGHGKRPASPPPQGRRRWNARR